MGLATQIAVAVTARSPTPGASSVAPTDSARPAPMRHSFPSAGAVTQAAFLPTAIDPTDPGGMDARRTTRPERSSSRTTAPSTPSTQTPAHPAGDRRRRHVANRPVIAPVVASARTTEKSGATAQSASSETARWLSTRFDVEPPMRGRPIRRPLGARRRIEARHRRRHRPDELRVPQAPAVRDPDRARRRTRCPSASRRSRASRRHATTERCEAPSARPHPRARARRRRPRVRDGVRPAGMCRTISPDSASMPDDRSLADAARSSRQRRRPAGRPRRALRLRSAEQIAVATSTAPAPSTPAAGVCGGRSDSSWVRIACWSSWSSGPGSSPSSETSVCRASA